MVWREGKNWNHHGNRNWGSSGGGFREQEEEDFYHGAGRSEGGRLGFQPGSGIGAQRDFGNLQQEYGRFRQGIRPRGSRSFGARRGGFGGRPGRSGFGGGACFSQGGDGPAGTNRNNRGEVGGLSGKEGHNSKVTREGAGKELVGGARSSNGSGAIHNDIGSEDTKGKKKVVMVEDSGIIGLGYDPTLFEDQKCVVDDVRSVAKVIGCSKCAQKGHVVADCTIEVCCDICNSDSHVNHRCPILKIPKPSVQAVGYAVEGLGFNHIPHTPLQRSKKGTKMALVKEWFEKEEGCLLPKVWIRVFGLRKRLREYLTLWVVGSLVGATQLVDMKTTRKSDFGRIFVAVLDPTIIPRKLDVVIGDHYFELKFEVEKKGFDENGEEVEFMQEGGGDGDGSKDNEKDMRDEEEEEEGRSPKRARNDDMVVEGKEGGNGDSEEAMSNGRGEREDEEVFLGGIADEVIDVAMEKVLGEIFDNIEVEGDGREDGQKRKRREEEGAGKEEKVVQLASVKEVLLTPKRAS
ncbi:hypothetical protein OsJ_17761 [Oryza sativa Japonica Group]|uniref:CCHC-type domain-containing protein n=3 Tax=Oryza sativa TaxID=4530 RepID=B9FNF8_ORYSJ|nr:hypothetical protein OsJ_17761 [Oryza sativa Japonica Group]